MQPLFRNGLNKSSYLFSLDITTILIDYLKTMADKSSESFFSKLFSSLFSSNDPEAEKKKRLKQIGKQLGKARFHYYKPGADEVLPAFAKLFYDIYKAVFPAKSMFQAQENPNHFKYMVVNYSLNEKQHELIEALSEESIKAQASSVPVNELQQQVKQNIEQFLAIFSTDKIMQIEGLYRKLMMFRSFCMYDFYFLLKKFDSSIQEGEFTTMPHFEKINSEYVGEDLKDFLTVAWVLPDKEDWSDLMKFFKEARGTEPVPLNVWNKIVAKLNAIRQSQVFEMLIQIISKDPNYVSDVIFQETPITDDYIEKIRSDAEKTIRSLATEQQNSKIDSLLNQIFGTSNVVRMHNYTEQGSGPFERKNLGKFLYVQPLNYYKAFLLDYIKKDLREFADLVLVRGTWSTNSLSTPMSDAYHALIDSSDALLAFDNKIAEDKEIGSKLKTLLPRSERDREARNIIGTTLGDLNDEAKAFCVEGTKNLVTIGKTVKALMEDYTKLPKSELIVNWKELEHFADHPIKELGVGVYKHIYLFVTLMQSCLS